MFAVIRRLVLAAGAASFLFLAGFVIFAATIVQYSSRAASNVDGIVVLTGGEKRVAEGLRLFSEGKAQRILISGVNKSTTREDLQRGTKLTPMLFNCCVDIGHEAQDTIGNADEARDWARTWNFKRVAIVTSNYHMPRGLIEFSRAMPGVEFVPQPVTSPNYRAAEWWLHPGAARLVLVEYLKFIPALARWGLVRVLGPGHAAENPMPDMDVAPPKTRTLPKVSGL